MFVNIIKSYRDVVSICDKELIGKYFEEDYFQLYLKESFYRGDGNERSEKEILEIIKEMEKEDATFNIVGEKAVSTALKSGVISEGNVKRIKGIPYVLVLM